MEQGTEKEFDYTHIKIEEVNFGIACRIKNTIYINKKLKLPKWKNLYETILNHELSHSNNFTKQDIINDINNYDLHSVKKEYSKFVLSTPSSWVEYLPFWFYKGTFALSPSVTFVWIIFLIILIIGMVLG